MSEIPPLSAIGIDFGGTTVKMGVVRSGAIIRRAPSLPTLDFATPSDLLGAIFASIAELRAAETGVAAVGVGLPGIVDSRLGIVHHLTNVPGWDEIPLRRLLADGAGLPAAIENDANAMTYAEWRFGAARGCANVVCVTLGTGVGGGLILDGRLYRGSRMGAGEIGNMSIDYLGAPGPYGNFGALEEYIGNQQIAARALAKYHLTGQTRDPLGCTPEALAEAARAGDPVARQIWTETGEMLGAALADVTWLLNPDAIVIGGGVAKAGELIFAPVRRAVNSRTSPVFHERLAILPASLGNDAGLIGCGALALDEAYRERNAPDFWKPIEQ